MLGNYEDFEIVEYAPCLTIVPGLARTNEEKHHEELYDCGCGYRRCWIVLCGVASTA